MLIYSLSFFFNFIEYFFLSISYHVFALVNAVMFCFVFESKENGYLSLML